MICEDILKFGGHPGMRISEWSVFACFGQTALMQHPLTALLLFLASLFASILLLFLPTILIYMPTVGGGMCPEQMGSL